MNQVAIVITTYNSEQYISRLLDSIIKQYRDDLFVIISDDGSTDNTLAILREFDASYKNSKVLELEHGERGLARTQAIQVAMEAELKYLMFLDSDMVLEQQLINECLVLMNWNPSIGALVIKELPISDYDNLMTKVKIFERTVINNSSSKLDKNSIEAARFWRSSAYLESGGINPNQIAFEETQPTIRYIENGGSIVKHLGKGLYHDEKKVTIKNILQKKKYHFSVMNKTLDSESNGMLKALKRWYFFRPVLYKFKNLILYLRHPLLTFGMVSMYFVLTFIGCFEIMKGKLIS